VSAGSSTGAAEAVIAPSTAGGRSGFLSDVLIELGFADRESVEHAVRAARSPGTTVARALVEMNVISEEQLARAIAERHGVAYVDLDSYPVDPAATNLIKPATARRYQAVPIGFADGAVLVAMADPADALGVNDVAHLSRRDVQPAAAARPALEGLLERLPLDEQPRDDEAPAGEAAAEPAEDGPPRAAEKLAKARHQLEEAEARAAEIGDRLAATMGELDQARAAATDADALRDELERARGEADALRDELERARGEADALRGELEGTHAETATLRGELERTRAALSAEEQRRRQLQERLSELEQAAGAAERAFEELRLLLSAAR
jgi:hypothetical protein